MPVVRIETVGKLTEEQKARIAREITETLKNVAGKSPESVYVHIQEVERENFAAGGVLFSQR